MTEQDDTIRAKVNSRFMFKTPATQSPRAKWISEERYGNHASYVADGWRHWGFDTERGRNLFAADFRRHCVMLKREGRRPSAVRV